MEGLPALLEDSFRVSDEKYATSTVHPRFSQYKCRQAGQSDQEVRRATQLSKQKQCVYTNSKTRFVSL